MSDYVLGFAFSKAGSCLLLVKKNRPAWQKDKLNGIGGKIEAGESPLQAMIREFKEETTLDVLDWHHYATLMFFDNVRVFVFSSMSCFLDDLEYAEKNSPTDEPLRVVYVDDVLKSSHGMMTNLQWLVPMAFDSGFKPTLTINYNEENSK